MFLFILHLSSKVPGLLFSRTGPEIIWDGGKERISCTVWDNGVYERRWLIAFHRLSQIDGNVSYRLQSDYTGFWSRLRAIIRAIIRTSTQQALYWEALRSIMSCAVAPPLNEWDGRSAADVRVDFAVKGWWAGVTKRSNSFLRPSGQKVQCIV